MSKIWPCRPAPVLLQKKLALMGQDRRALYLNVSSLRKMDAGILRLGKEKSKDDAAHRRVFLTQISLKIASPDSQTTCV